MYYPASDDELEEIFLKRLNKMVLTKEEELKFKTAFMLFVGREYHKLDWAMQLHYGCKRDNNTLMFEKLGPDTGYDCINNYAPSAQMADFLNALSTNNEIPKTILYSLNPNDNASIGTIIGCFQEKFPGKIQQGSAWWFNDHKIGMEDQMIRLAAERGIADRFHFPGFMKGKQVYEVLKASDVYIMPSVSEPFGISPLEAMQCSVPSIISKQSGCAEILDKCIKTDYWDIHAMADAIYSICTYPAMYEYLKEEGKKEVDEIKWENVGYKVRGIYDEVIKNYGKQ